MSIEDAFKVLISGGIVGPSESSMGVPLQMPYGKAKREQPLSDMLQQQMLPTEESS
jgi:uncharacterized membrane protein